nr:unnamed protein product [Callosobruchus analis]
MVTKFKYSSKPNNRTIFNSLRSVRQYALDNNILHIAFPKIGCGLDHRNWGVIQKVIKYIFRDTQIKIDLDLEMFL